MSLIEGTGTAKYECKTCKRKGKVKMSDLDFEEVERAEKDMGPEYHHSATHEIVCPKCKNDISLTFEAWEYPEGQISAKDTQASGAVILSKFDVDGFGITLGDQR